MGVCEPKWMHVGVCGCIMGCMWVYAGGNGCMWVRVEVLWVYACMWMYVGAGGCIWGHVGVCGMRSDASTVNKGMHSVTCKERCEDRHIH